MPAKTQLPLPWKTPSKPGPIRRTSTSPSVSTCSPVNRGPVKTRSARRPTSPPNLEGFEALSDYGAMESVDDVPDGWLKERIKDIELAEGRYRKKLANRLYYSTYGKKEDLSEYYTDCPPITGRDVNNKPYSF